MIQGVWSFYVNVIAQLLIDFHDMFVISYPKFFPKEDVKLMLLGGHLFEFHCSQCLKKKKTIEFTLIMYTFTRNKSYDEPRNILSWNDRQTKKIRNWYFAFRKLSILSVGFVIGHAQKLE